MASLTILLGTCLIALPITRNYEDGMELYDNLRQYLLQDTEYYGPNERYRNIKPTNIKYLNWKVVGVGITAIVSGICLLFGSIKHNRVAVHFHLFPSIISIVMLYIWRSHVMAEAVLVEKLIAAHDPLHLPEARLMYDTGRVLFGVALLFTGFWIYAFIFHIDCSYGIDKNNSCS